MSHPRFHVPEVAPGARIVLPDHSARHAREVLRLRAGARVRVFDGEGHEFEAQLDEVSRRRVALHVTGQAEPLPESPLRLVLAAAPLRGDRMELVIQKATELGVSELWPVVTARTDAAARPALRGSRADRWHKVASGAAEQCGRAVVPHIAPTAPLASVLSTPFGGAKLLFVERSGEPGLSQRPPLEEAAALALVGPPGGWEPQELERIREAGFARHSLGPRVLRAETAAIVAVALVQALWGDLA